jgi:plastocyanin
MGRLLAIALAVAAAGIAVVAVNGPGKDKPADKDTLTPVLQSTQVSTIRPDGRVQTPGQRTEAHAPIGATVVMRKLAFHPPNARVRAGQAVRFVNKDDVGHTVIQDFGPRSGEIPQFESKTISPGQAFTFVARSAGTIDYVCTLHPSVMSGRLVVTGANS